MVSHALRANAKTIASSCFNLDEILDKVNLTRYTGLKFFSARGMKMATTNKKVSPVKMRVVEFVRDTAMDGVFEFKLSALTVDGRRYTEEEAVLWANNFVHRMRVELARLRAKVKARKYVPKQFKMVVRNIRLADDEIIVTLAKVANLDTRTQEDVEELFSSLACGKVME